MSPFQRFRLWLRVGAASERLVGAVALVVAVALLMWAVASPSDGPHDGATTGVSAVAGAGPSTTVADSPTSEVSGGVTGAASSSGTPGQATPRTAAGPGAGPSVAASGSHGCTSPPGSAPGVSASQVKIAVTLTEIGGAVANSAFGIPTADEQKADFQQVIDAVNAEGGVACRKLVAQYFNANPAEKSQLEQVCREVSDAGVFAEVDFTAYIGMGDCFAQRKIPYFSGYLLFQSHKEKWFPYMFGPDTFDSVYHNAVFALRDRGFFKPDNGFKKLGFIYRSCDGELISRFNGWLQQAGVAAADVVSYDVGCPDVFASPQDLAQAVLKFQRSGVTHMTTAYFLGDIGNFTKVAERQGFRPKWGIGDDGTINLTYGGQGADPANIANAIAVANSRWGEERTPGVTPTAGTARCNAIYAAHGQKPVYQQGIGAGGTICDVIWMLDAAIDHAPSLQQTSLVAGLRAAKSIDYSFPMGPNDFSGDKVTTGGQFFRTAQFQPSCSCWQLLDRDFRRGY